MKLIEKLWFQNQNNPKNLNKILEFAQGVAEYVAANNDAISDFHVWEDSGKVDWSFAKSSIDDDGLEQLYYEADSAFQANFDTDIKVYHPELF